MADQVRKIGQNEIARRCYLNSTTLKAYMEGRAIPQDFRVPMLAEATGETAERVRELVRQAREEKNRALAAQCLGEVTSHRPFRPRRSPGGAAAQAAPAGRASRSDQPP